MANDKPQGSILPLLVIVAAIWFFTQQGTPKPVQPDPVKPTPDVTEPKPVTAQDAWEMLAYTVEKKADRWRDAAAHRPLAKNRGHIESLRNTVRCWPR